jgi:hypothetical protein
MMARMFRAIVFFGLTTSAFASATLDVLVNADPSFSATIQQQLEMLQSNPSPAEFAEKTIDYAEAKGAYFKALRTEVPELMKIATGKEANPRSWIPSRRPLELLAKTRRRWRTKRPWFCQNDFRAILTLRRREWSSTARKRSKRNSIIISMESISLSGKAAKSAVLV